MKSRFIITAILLAVSMISSTAGADRQQISRRLIEESRKYSLDSTPTSVPTPTSIPGILQEKYPGSRDWEYIDAKSNSLEEMYGFLPNPISEYTDSIKQAKIDAGVTREHIGCGPLGMIAQFDLLSSMAGYSLFNPQESRIWNGYPSPEPSLSTSTYILKTFQAMDFGSLGSGVLPAALASQANAYMLELGASSVVKNPDGTFEDEDLINGLIYPSMAGPRNMSQAEKEKLIQNEIDLGMPVLWDTVCISNPDKLGPYSSHVMNLVGYRTYEGISASGETLEYTFYDVMMNWGFMDSIVDPIYFTGGNQNIMIPFFQIHDSIRIRPRDYGFPCSYNNAPLTTTVTDVTGREIKVERLRTGYINHYDNSLGADKFDQQFIVLSCNRKDGTSYLRDAYIQYTLPEGSDWIRFDLSLWGDNEKLLNTGTDYVNLEVQDEQGNWVVAERLLPKLLLSGTYLRDFTHFDIHLAHPTKGVRIVAHDSSGNSSSNRGRVVLGNFNAVLPL